MGTGIGWLRFSAASQGRSSTYDPRRSMAAEMIVRDQVDDELTSVEQRSR